MTTRPELVSAFQVAGFATTPGKIGSAREVPVRKKIMQILPRGVGVGSGCVIDSYGNTSRQIDVVLYEKDLATAIRVPYQRVNEVVRKRRGVTPSTGDTIRLSKFLGTIYGLALDEPATSSGIKTFTTRTSPNLA